MSFEGDFKDWACPHYTYTQGEEGDGGRERETGRERVRERERETKNAHTTMGKDDPSDLGKIHAEFLQASDLSKSALLSPKMTPLVCHQLCQAQKMEGRKLLK